MGWLSIIPELIGLAREWVPDKDKQTAMVGRLNELGNQLYLAELNTKTHPILDGIHKLGRQFLGLVNMGVCAWLISSNPEIDPAQLLVMAGPTGLYTYMKGKGR